jgi:hypothetical protein
LKRQNVFDGRLPDDRGLAAIPESAIFEESNGPEIFFSDLSDNRPQVRKVHPQKIDGPGQHVFAQSVSAEIAADADADPCSLTQRLESDLSEQGAGDFSNKTQAVFVR